RQIAVADLDQSGQSGLAVERGRIVNGAGDAPLLEERCQLIAPRGADGELMVNGLHPWTVGQQPEVAGTGQGAVVSAGDLAAAGVVLVEQSQPAVEDGGLKAVEPAVGADSDVVVSACLAVVGEAPHPLGELAVVAGGGAAVAEA